MWKRIGKMLTYVLSTLLLLIGLIVWHIWNNFGKNPSPQEQEKYAKLPYYKNGQFQSPEPLYYDLNNIRNGEVGFIHMLIKSKFAPNHKLPKVMLDRSSFPKIPEDYALYWLGHSTVILELNGKRLLFDPVFDHAAPIPLALLRYDEAPIKRRDLPIVDYVVITHNHYDHLEKKTVQAIKEGHFIVPLGIGAALRGWGIDKDRIIELGWDEVFEKDGLTIIATEGIHYSHRSPWNRNKTLWNSYIVRATGKSIFLSGDTGYGSHLARISTKYGPFDMVALEIDGWNTGWPNNHMFPHEVVQAAQELGTKNILPIHWAVFDLALHPWHESIDMVLEEAQGKGLNIMTPQMGERIVPGITPTEHWWKSTKK
jgi:L-ascorbate metabolism protein UlaG (beta-lactamase superfamily)